MRIEELCRTLNIPYITEGNEHCTRGWIQFHCPFCEGSANYHLGFSLEKEFFHCWRCGGHPVVETLSKLSGLPPNQIRELIRQYGGRSRVKTSSKVTPRMKAFKFPSGCSPLQLPHKQYLISRNFDPDKLEQEWELKGTGPVSFLDHIDYKNRIIAPIYWKGKIVSFQGRSISKQAKIRYKACPKDREIIEHQTILYGKQEKWKKTGICVEGITDVWRLGTYAFAVFGISYTLSQIKQIAHHFERVAVVFDNDPQAKQQANKLIAELRIRGVNAWKEEIEGDPGDMKDDDARHLVKQIVKKYF